jgi:hypothetical protein
MSRSTMNARLLAVMAVVVVGGMLALYFLVIRDDGTASDPANPANPTAGPTASRDPNPSTTTTRTAPSLPPDPSAGGSTPTAPDPGSAMTTTGSDGKAPPIGPSPIDKANPTVTDHRTGSTGGTVIPGTGTKVESGRQLPSERVTTLAEAARPGMTACGAAIPAAARGSRPKVAAVATVSITGGTLRVADSRPVVMGVDDAVAVTDAEACIRKALAGIEVPAPGEPDLSGYEINLSYAVR